MDKNVLNKLIEDSTESILGVPILDKQLYAEKILKEAVNSIETEKYNTLDTELIAGMEVAIEVILEHFNMEKMYTTRIEEDEFGELVIPIPDEVCDKLDWYPGDELVWTIEQDKIILKKKNG